MDHDQVANDHASEGRGAVSAASLEAGVQIGDFRIERRLGAGGMGIVYQARQLSLNRPVALKVLGQALTRSADVARFQREAQAAARLKHPAIAQVFYIGQDRHLCYLAMELIDGVSLRRVLDRLARTGSSDTGLDTVVRDELAIEPAATAVRFDAPTEGIEESPTHDPPAPQAAAEPVNPYLSPAACEVRSNTDYVRRVCQLVRDAALALAHAHQQGVIHRDIKPDNLLLDRGGKVHVIDFGVARFFDDQAMTYTGQLVGTPLYMSPEQVTGRGAIDTRSDIYSLGLVLYELLALRPPIEAANREHLLRTIVTKPLPPVSWCNRAVPADLERVVHRATQKDPDQRYASAADLATDIDRFLAGQPVAAPPYHFRLDEREIIAARPSQAVLAAFAVFAVGAFVFVAGASLAAMVGVGTLGSPSAWEGISEASVTIVAITLLLAGGIGTGKGIMRARPWAWWTGLAAMALIACISIVGLGFLVAGASFVLTVSSEWFDFLTEAADDEALATEADEEISPKYLLLAFIFAGVVPAVTGLVLGGGAVWALLARATRDWFRFARDIRREHQLLKERLAE